MRLPGIGQTLIVMTGTFFLVACGTKEGAHQPVGAKNTNGKAISFTQVLPIFQARCARCHNAGTNDWTKEENVRRVALSGLLARRISAGTMPQAGSPESSAITKDERSTIVAWAQSLTPAGAGEPSAPGKNDDVRNRNLAVIERCAACHGYNGNSISPDIPNLASHNKSYLLSRLTGFLVPGSAGPMPENLKTILKEQNLTYSVKNATTVTLSQELKETLAFIADYFANENVLPSAAEFKKKQKALGKDPEAAALFAKGGKILAEQCVLCHLQSDYLPGDGFPMIFGQKANYLQARLAQFRAGEGGDLMPAILAAASPPLTNDDYKAIILYVSNVHPTQVQPTPP